LQYATQFYAVPIGDRPIFNNSGSEIFDDDRQSSAAVRAAFDDCHRFVVLRPSAAQPMGVFEGLFF
jgi:hypothetical protein